MENEEKTMDRLISDKEKRSMKIRRMAKVGSAVVVAGIAVYAVTQFMRSSVNLSNLIVDEISRGTIETTITANGTVVPGFEEAIVTPINTKVLEIYAQSGDVVEEGAPLLRLDLQSAQDNYDKLLNEQRMRELQMEQLRANKHTLLSDREMQIKVAEMQLNRLGAELKNEQYLDSIGSGTMERVRQAELAVTTATLELEQMRQRYANECKVSETDMQLKQLENNIFAKGLEESRRILEGAEIRSPRRATLTFIYNEGIGTQIAAGTKVAVISDLTHFRLKCNIADAYSDRVRSGGQVVVKIGDTQLDGTITSVTPTSKDGLIDFTVSLKEANHAKLRSGLRVDVHVLTSVRDNVLRIKNSSFYKGPNSYRLFVLTPDGEAEQREVALGDCNFDYVEVVSGLSEGDRVVISDMSNYMSMQKIKVKE